MADLNALLERVKAASGPDRELDLALSQALGVPWSYIGEPPRGIECPRLTASLDAALALVERAGMTVETTVREAIDETWGWVEDVPDYRQRLILALLAALLSSLIAAPEKGSEA